LKHFIHSGDLGDVVYALPTIRAMGGGILHLIDSPGMTAHGMPPERARLLLRLLEAQPYIQAVRLDYVPHPGDPATIPVVDLNAFRFSGQDFVSTFLPDTVLNTFGLPVAERDTAWLEVSHRAGAAAVVIARSARYHNPRFPWHTIMGMYEDNAVFVGTPDEHTAFVKEFGTIQHQKTEDLLMLAKIIAGADLFIGNQSAPLAIAHGLKQNAVVEVCPYCPNCIDPRPNCWPGFDGNIQLPDLEELYAVCQ